MSATSRSNTPLGTFNSSEIESTLKASYQAQAEQVSKGQAEFYKPSATGSAWGGGWQSQGGLMAKGQDLASTLFASYEVLKKGNGVVSSGAGTPTTTTSASAIKGAKK